MRYGGDMVQYHCKTLKSVCLPPYVASWEAAGCNEIDPGSLLLGTNSPAFSSSPSENAALPRTLLLQRFAMILTLLIHQLAI
jgi:hypothetical protein